MKLGSVMLGLLAAGGIAAVEVAHGSDMFEGWLYLGRRSGDSWKPPSASIARPVYPVKAGGKVVVRRDALVYGSVDCKVIDVGEFKLEGRPQPVLRVTADRQALEIVGKTIECPSVGQAVTVWANVRIPAARLVSAEK